MEKCKLENKYAKYKTVELFHLNCFGPEDNPFTEIFRMISVSNTERELRSCYKLKKKIV